MENAADQSLALRSRFCRAASRLDLKAKARATGTGFAASGSEVSRGVLESLGDAGLDRLRGLGCQLLHQRSERLGLFGERLELLAGMRGRHFHDVRRRLHRQKRDGVI